MSDRIRVVGYAQRVFYNDGIEYRNFSPDLVGLQLTSSGGTALFTMGNFAITTNLEPKVSKTFATNSFSNFVSLTDMNANLESTISILNNNTTVVLNLDKTKLTNYALFGPLTEYIRVSLEHIISYWPASLYVKPQYTVPPLYTTQSGYTIQDYTYNEITNLATFKVNTNTIVNPYQLNYLTNGDLSATFNSNNKLRDVITSYTKYSILYNGINYDLSGFTGSTQIYGDYVYLMVQGNPFSAFSSNDYVTYHIKPNETEENYFFNSLDNFEYYLLNRQVVPLYTATFKYSVKSDSGAIIYLSQDVTWPTTDGYNLDFDTEDYVNYAQSLLTIGTAYDETTSNLMIRFLVTESITDFDTTSTHLDPLDEDTSDQKMNKTLVIYGREYDELNNYIQGIKFAHSVSYDKLDNTPDVYLKNIARILGWDLISSVLEADLINNYLLPKPNTYSGHTVGYTPIEADNELWRRIILNTPYIWKSKGTRKAIEFLFKFIGTPLGLIKFNEYVYLAENKIDLNQFTKILELNNLPTNLDAYPVNLSGYPYPFPNTPNSYFQNKGLWYRETGGMDAIIDVNTGNNPHVGPYDGGYTYFAQFRNLIPNFTAVTLSSQTIVKEYSELFNNYNNGTFTDYVGDTYVDVIDDLGADFSNCVILTPTIISDPYLRPDLTNCGCPEPGNYDAMSLCVRRNNIARPCSADIISSTLTPPYNYYLYDLYQYNIDGSIYTNNGVNQANTTYFIDKACCTGPGNTTYLYNELNNLGQLVNTGYICCDGTKKCGCFVTCKWNLDSSIYTTITTDSGVNYNFLVFVDELGVKRIASQDGCNCIGILTQKLTVTDPYTNQTGIGCSLTAAGLADLNNPNSIIKNTYLKRKYGYILCDAVACMLDISATYGAITNGVSRITVTPTSGAEPYIYTWYNGSNIVKNGPENFFDAQINVTYTVMVTDAFGCTATLDVTATQAPITCTLTTSYTSVNTISNTGKITLVPAGGTQPYTYSWQGPSNESPMVQYPDTTQTLSNLSPGQYIGTVTDANGCTATANVTIYNVTCTIAATISVVGNSATVNVTGAQGGIKSYTWGNGLGNTQTIVNIPPGQIYVIVEDNYGCTAYASAEVGFSVAVLVKEQTQTTPNAVQIWYNVNGGTPIMLVQTNIGTSYVTVGTIPNLNPNDIIEIGVKTPTGLIRNVNFYASPETPQVLHCGTDTVTGDPYVFTVTNTTAIYLNVATNPQVTPNQIQTCAV